MFLIKPAYAEITNPLLKDSKAIATNPTGYTNTVIQTLITVLFVFGIIFFVFQIIMSGYKMMSSQGDPKKTEEAQHSLTSSLVGLVIIFSIFVILKLVGTIFGIDLQKITWPSL